MKYLMAFESYGDNLTSVEMQEIQEKTEDSIEKMSLEERSKLIGDLEKFANDHGVSVEDLEDPELVKSLLVGVKEGLGQWISKNWYSLADSLSKYLKLGSLVVFVGSLIGYYVNDMDTMTGVKVAAAAFIIANIVSALKGLK